MKDIVYYSKSLSALESFKKQWPHALIVNTSDMAEAVRVLKNTFTSVRYLIAEGDEDLLQYVPTGSDADLIHTFNNSLIVPWHTEVTSDFHGFGIAVSANMNPEYVEFEGLQNITEPVDYVPTDAITVVYGTEERFYSEDVIHIPSLGEDALWPSLATQPKSWIHFQHVSVAQSDTTLRSKLDPNSIHRRGSNYCFTMHKDLIDTNRKFKLAHLKVKDHHAPNTVVIRASWPVYQDINKLEASNHTEALLVPIGSTVNDTALEYVPEIHEHEASVLMRETDSRGFSIGGGGVKLVNKGTNKSVYSKAIGSSIAEFDIIFLSNNESFADDHYAQLKERFPRAKRVNGVKGIGKAHQVCAEVANTDMFWVVDADSVVVSDFKFDFIPPRSAWHKVYVFRSKNPVNNLIYGHGGVKLFPRNRVLSADTDVIDFTTSLGDFSAVSVLSNINAYDKSGWHVWRTAVREAAKLQNQVKLNPEDLVSARRLEQWLTVGEGEYGNISLKGARFGADLSLNTISISPINNDEWLRGYYDEVHEYGDDVSELE